MCGGTWLTLGACYWFWNIKQIQIGCSSKSINGRQTKVAIRRRLTCQIYEMKAAMCAGPGDVIGPINNDSEHTVASRAAFIHLCLCHSPVAGPDLHDFEHILRA
jgi:hypothetical protein